MRPGKYSGFSIDKSPLNQIFVRFPKIMANKKSALKEMRKTATNTARNLMVRTRLKTLTKKARAALAGEDVEAARTAVTHMISAYDKAVKSNVVHKNKARRFKSAFSAELAAKA